MTTIEQIEQTKNLVKQGIMTCDIEFLLMNNEALVSICNGCGAADAKFDFVPDTMYGLYIGEACHTHDFDYFKGMTADDKEKADKRAYNNWCDLIDHRSHNRFIAWFRKRRALKYYIAVKQFGDDAFYGEDYERT